jgi:WXXGXW repeat (2 copies)
MDLARIALLVAVCLADGLLLLKVAPAAAAEIITNVAPPPLRAENPGRPRDGYTWASGHWEWSGQEYRWVPGSWIVEHGKAHWVADQWEQMGTQWRYLPGHWEHSNHERTAASNP